MPDRNALLGTFPSMYNAGQVFGIACATPPFSARSSHSTYAGAPYLKEINDRRGEVTYLWP